MDTTVAKQFEYIRREARFNMFDRNGVMGRANALGFHELVVAAVDGYMDLLTSYEAPDEDEYQEWAATI